MGEIRIVGTAHVSQKSIDQVRAGIEEFQPEIVAVELDQARYEALKKQAKEPSVADVLKSGNFTQLLVQWLLAYVQRRIGMDVGVEPGADMKAAMEEAESRKLPIALIDRDIRITLARFLGSMSLWEKMKMVYALMVSLIAADTEKIDVDQLTSQDVVTAALEEFRKFSPRGAHALIDERDAYLANQLVMLSRTGHRVLAVIGAGHVQGVQRYLAAPETLPPMETLTAPVKSRNWMAIFEVVVAVFFGLMLVAIIFSGVGLEVLLTALLYWVLIHGTLCALFTLLAGGHPLSALTGFAVSWFTALHPLLAAGWFSAIVEAKIRKPKVQDFRAIMDAQSFSEMRHVPLFRVVLVAALANVGSTLGTIAYFIVIPGALGTDPGAIITLGFQNLWSAILGLFW